VSFGLLSEDSMWVFFCIEFRVLKSLKFTSLV
jgi:hypothetical protein